MCEDRRLAIQAWELEMGERTDETETAPEKSVGSGTEQLDHAQALVLPEGPESRRAESGK
jgi:hypothetical protein